MSDFTQLLAKAGAGDRDAAANLFTLVYSDLKQLAGHYLAKETPGHSLQPTALVHEAFLRLVGTAKNEGVLSSLPWSSRGRFFGAAANAMRKILIDAARSRMREKRGGGKFQRVPLDPDIVSAPEMAEDLVALDEALEVFSTVEPAMAELVTLRYFGGLTLKETALALKISPRTADSYWAYARAWLMTEIQRRQAAS